MILVPLPSLFRLQNVPLKKKKEKKIAGPCFLIIMHTFTHTHKHTYVNTDTHKQRLTDTLIKRRHTYAVSVKPRIVHFQNYDPALPLKTKPTSQYHQ